MWILFLRKHPENHQKLDKYLLDFFIKKQSFFCNRLIDKT